MSWIFSSREWLQLLKCRMCKVMYRCCCYFNGIPYSYQLFVVTSMVYHIAINYLLLLQWYTISLSLWLIIHAYSIHWQLNPDFERYFPKMADFWLVSLDSNQRRQLLTPLKETVKSLIQSYWHKTNLCRVRIYQIFNKLFNFMLSRGGLGIWTSIAPNE